MWRRLQMIIGTSESLREALNEVECQCRESYDLGCLLEAEEPFDRDVLAGAPWQERCIRYQPRRGGS